MTVSMPTASGDISPATNPSSAMQGLMKLTYEGVMRLDDRHQPENWLAESVTRTDTGYSITLRKGVLLHNGRGLTAQDVIDSHKAIVDAEASPYKELIAPITSITLVSEREFTVETEQGYAALYALTFPVFYASEDEGGLPSGTGPYFIQSYEKGESMDFLRWESWWRTPALIPSIHCVAREDAESTLNTFQTGSIDICAVDMLTLSSVAQRSHVTRQDHPTGQAELLLPNLSGALSDRQLRQVIAHALNKRDIISNTYQNHGVAVDVPLMPDSWLSERTGGIEYDLETAKSLLQTLGWRDADDDGYVERNSGAAAAPTTPDASGDPGATDEPDTTEEPDTTDDTNDDDKKSDNDLLTGLLGENGNDNPNAQSNKLELVLLTNEEDSSSHKDAAGRIVTQLGQVGISVTVESVAFDKLDAAITEGNYDLLLIGYKLPENGNLRSLLHSEGLNNRMGYSNAQMDAALDSLTTVTSADEYYNAMQNIYNLIVEELPVFTVCMRTRTQISGESLTIPNIIREGEPYRGVESWTNIES